MIFDQYKKKLENNNEIYLKIKARPNAKKTEVREIMADGAIKIDLATPPVKGRANQELIKFLAQEFGVARDDIKIISGAWEKTKLIHIKRS